LRIPAGTIGGRLVFDNWGSEPSRIRIRNIEIREIADAETEFRAAIAAEENGNSEAATNHYKAALTIDPSHAESIAGLGRLRFIPPRQPLLDEVKRRTPPVDVCEVVIAVRNPCNYRCFYCVGAGSNNEPVKRFDFAEIEKQYGLIQSKLIVTSLECGGGEPTVHPQFPELLKLCAHYGIVSFPTNNSQNPERWLPTALGRRIEIRGALHPEGEQNLEKYVHYARYLIDAGCDFRCVFIAHPAQMEQVPVYGEMFGNQGIPFLALPFIGTFNSQPYPTHIRKASKSSFSNTLTPAIYGILLPRSARM
jgi:hypothetical protein